MDRTTNDAAQAGDAGDGDRTTDDTEADLARRVAELEATVARLTEALEQRTAVAPTPDLTQLWPVPRPAERTEPTLTADEPAHGPSQVDGPTAFDRRRLLSRAGTAAVGAVIGGAAASVAAASPAAAASASFDTSTATPAVDAVSTGTGSAVRARNDAPYGGATSQALALEAQGFSRLNGQVVVGDSGFQSRALFVSNAPDTLQLGLSAYGKFAGVEGNGGGYGVFGYSPTSIGVVGVSYDGIGLMASGGKAGLLFRGPGPSAIAPPPQQTIAHQNGELVFDENADLWLCTADGTPGTWIRLGGLATSGAFTPLANPVRVYDSRPNQKPVDVFPKTPLTGGTSRSIDLTKNASGVPTDATAAVVTLTVTGTTGGSPNGPSYVALYRDGTPWPGTSTLNWTAPGSTIATTTVVPLGPGAKLAAYAATATDLIIDVVGYYR